MPCTETILNDSKLKYVGTKMALRSERLKKLEVELTDLEQWLKLGLVPKKDLQKHKEEIATVKGKIKEERERLQFLKDTDEAEEYTTPKRPPARAAFTDSTSMSDVEMNNDGSDMHFELESEGSDNFDSGSSQSSSEDSDSEETESAPEEDDTDLFSGRGRFRRGWDRDILDPDSDDW